jgi:hypothetical protein
MMMLSRCVIRYVDAEMCRAGHIYYERRCVCVVRIYPVGFRSVVVRHSMLATGVARASASQRGLSAQGPPLAPGPVSATGVTDASSSSPLSAGGTFDERGRC